MPISSPLGSISAAVGAAFNFCYDGVLVRSGDESLVCRAAEERTVNERNAF